MSNRGAASASGVFSKLKQAFHEKFVIGHDHKPYLPPTPTELSTGTKPADLPSNPYRYPSPADQPKPDIPVIPSETVYDIAYYKRSQIKLQPPPGANPQE